MVAEPFTGTIGVIGGGSMGGSVARGLVEAGAVDAARVLVADHHAEHRDALAELGIRTFADEKPLLGEKPDVVVLAVKPQVIGGVLVSCAPHVAGRLVVSVAAGVTLATLEEALPGARVVRAMPNLPVAVRSGATAVAAGASAEAGDAELVRGLFSALGVAEIMREDQLDVASVVAGCSPAFFALFVDALTRAGIRAGMPAAACRRMVEATMRGTAEQLVNEGVHPREYLEGVTSPGGTTAAALYALEPALVSGSYAAVDAALERTRQLG